MTRSRGRPLVALLAIIRLGAAAAALDVPGAWAQMQAPPFGWDMWDPAWRQRDVWQSERMDPNLSGRQTRQQTFLREGVPQTYRGASNPLPRTPETVAKGGTLYTARCAPCHDAAGMGHGNAGLALYPSPALLAELIRRPQAVDPYLLWAISEGGAPFGTGMPAFKSKLSQEQIWQIIAYMRAGFPGAGATGQR